MRALSLLLALALGCRTPAADPPAPEVRVPDAFSAGDEEGAVVPGAWWADFAEPGLDAAVREALEHNRDLAAAAARVLAAEAQARIVGADRRPFLDGNASSSRDQRVLVGLPFPGGTARSLNYTHAVGLNITWEADLWGRLAAREEAALSDLAATAWEHAAARESIAAQTAKAWIVWQEARLQESLASETVASFRANTDVVRQRYERGLVGALDLRLAESNTASAEALMELRREEVERGRRTLEILLGRYPEGGTDPPDPIGLPDVPPRPPAGLPAGLLRRRPDLRSLEDRLRAASLRLYEARADLYPRLSLSGSAGRTSESSNDLSDSDFDIWSLAANLTQPLYQGGRLRAGVDLADARVRETLAGLEQGMLLAFAEVETALAVDDHLTRREESLRTASDDAAAARDIAEERYSSGLTALIAVLEAQRRALNNESEWLAARRERLVARIDLHLALGGGFEGDVE